MVYLLIEMEKEEKDKFKALCKEKKTKMAKLLREYILEYIKTNSATTSNVVQ